MKIFKKGDKVKYSDGQDSDDKMIVDRQEGNSVYYQRGGWDNAKDLELVENMNQEIEVGDIINGGFGDLEVLSVNKEQADIKVDYKRLDNNNKDWGYFTSKDIKSKANKQEIVGYELLKDLPGIPAGTKKMLAGYDSIDFNQFTFNEELKDTTWFKPIYKAKEVVVKISKGREARINRSQVELVGFGLVSPQEFKDFYEKDLAMTMLGKWTISYNNVQVGCQEFTKEDIQLVYQAIQNLK